MEITLSRPYNSMIITDALRSVLGCEEAAILMSGRKSKTFHLSRKHLLPYEVTLHGGSEYTTAIFVSRNIEVTGGHLPDDLGKKVESAIVDTYHIGTIGFYVPPKYQPDNI